MGVAWVFETTQSERSIELIFEQAGAIAPPSTSKHFRVDCTWYKPQQQIATLINGFYLIHHSNFPDSAFIINANKPDSQTPSESGSVERPATTRSSVPPRATADKGFELQLEKFLSAGLTMESGKFELVGNEYILKDFRLRVGTVTLSSSVKGTIVEIEYAASNIVIQCQALLQEIIDIFFSDYNLKPPEIIQKQSTQPDNYTAIDTAQQYLDIFSVIRKRINYRI